MNPAMNAHLAYIAILSQGLPTGWHKVELTKSLSVALPEHAGPSEITSPNRPKVAQDEDLKYWAFTDGKISFVIGVSTFTPLALAETTPDKILGNSVRGSLDGLEGSAVKSQRDTLFDGWPAVDFALAGQDVSGVSRSVMVGTTMYQLLMVYPTAKGRPEGAETYLGSLAISPPPPPGPLKSAGPVFRTFTPDDAKCAIDMPAKPKPLETKAVDGSKAAFTQYIAEYGNRAYMLCYLDAPKGKTPAGQNDQGRDRSVRYWHLAASKPSGPRTGRGR